MSLYRNQDGYFDPTAGEALSRIRRQEKRRRSLHRSKQNRKETPDHENGKEKGVYDNEPLAESSRRHCNTGSKGLPTNAQET